MLSNRRFHLAFLVVAGLCALSATSRAVDPRLLPANTEFVFSINVKQILESDLIKSKPDAIKAVRAELDNPVAADAMKYLKDMGFDPLTHLNTITVAHPGSKSPEDFFIVIDGEVDVKKFTDTTAAAAKDHPGSLNISKFGTTSIYEVSVEGKTGFVALVNGKSLVVSAKEELVKGAITQSKGTTIAATKSGNCSRPPLPSRALTSSSPARPWAGSVSRPPRETAFPTSPKLWKALTASSGAITITKEINFQLGIGAKTKRPPRRLPTPVSTD